MELPQTSKVFVRTVDPQRPALGYGVFAKRPIRRGEIIFIAKGRVFHIPHNSKATAATYPNALGIDDRTWIDPPSSNPLRFMNHSCEPNAGIKGKVLFVALRAIQKGEHITFDYSISESDPYWKLESRCRCGAKTCRGIIRSVQHLPEATFTRYLPYVGEHFKHVYKNHAQRV